MELSSNSLKPLSKYLLSSSVLDPAFSTEAPAEASAPWSCSPVGRAQ